MLKLLFSSMVLLLTSEAQAAERSCAALKISPVLNSVLTLFKTNGDLYLVGIPEYAQYLKNNGILDILVGSYSGEASLMNLCDRTALIRAWVDAVSPLGIGVFVQITGGLPFTDTLLLAQLCVELNVKAIVILPQTIYPPQTVDEAVADIQLIANVAAGIPIIFEDISPFETLGSISTADIIKSVVARIPCVAGVITSMNVAFNIKTDPSLGDKLIIIAGQETTSAAVQLFSANVNSLTNLFPRLVLDIVAAVQAGDLVLADVLQTELNLNVTAVIGEGDLAIKVRTRAYTVTQKVALALITGLKLAVPRLPLQMASEELVNQIANALKNLGVPLVGTVESVLEDVV